MKYCVKCGNELFDHAVICTSCGCMIEQPLQNPASTEAKKGKTSILPTVFNFISDLFAIFVLFWLAFSVATVYIGFYYGYYHSFDEGGTILALLSAFPAFVSSIVSLVVSLTGRCGKSAVFSAIKRIVLGLSLILISFIFIANT